MVGCRDETLGRMDELIPGRLRAEPVARSLMFESGDCRIGSGQSDRTQIGGGDLFLDLHLGQIDGSWREQLGCGGRMDEQPS